MYRGPRASIGTRSGKHGGRSDRLGEILLLLESLYSREQCLARVRPQQIPRKVVELAARLIPAGV